jgi:hypothetical protein
MLVKTIQFDDKGDVKDPVVFLYVVKDGKFVLQWAP